VIIQDLTLFVQDIDQRIVRAAATRILIAPIIYMVAIGVSFLSTGISIALYTIIVILHILPGRLDRYMASPENTEAE
jgi:hypothetical protein